MCLGQKWTPNQGVCEQQWMLDLMVDTKTMHDDALSMLRREDMSVSAKKLRQKSVLLLCTVMRLQREQYSRIWCGYSRKSEESAWLHYYASKNASSYIQHFRTMGGVMFLAPSLAYTGDADSDWTRPGWLDTSRVKSIGHSTFHNGRFDAINRSRVVSVGTAFRHAKQTNLRWLWW